MTTHWSVVVNAGRGDSARAQEALRRLCQLYWPPLYAFVRRSGYSREDAQDLTQEFFARLLERNTVARADPRSGPSELVLVETPAKKVLISPKNPTAFVMSNQSDTPRPERPENGRVMAALSRSAREVNPASRLLRVCEGMVGVFRARLIILLAALVLASARLLSAPGPNILLIVADDMGYNDTSLHGNTNFPTPRIDALAAGGVRFGAGYVSASVCSPARAGLMTGRYQQRFGHESNPPAGTTRGLSTNEVTLAQLLKSAGYVTGCVGKWHLGEPATFYPTRRGFDMFWGFTGAGRSYFPIANPKSYEVITSNGVVQAETGYTTDRFGQVAADFIRRHAGQPWFLYLCFNAVHSPLDADPARMDRLTNFSYATPDRWKQAAVTLALDDNVGLVLDTLETLNLATNTLVIFINDNGGDPDWPSDNSPLRGAKVSLYEGGIRVPFLMRWPGRIPPGQVLSPPVSSLDVVPTLLAAAGVAVPTNRPLDGVNLLPLLTGQTNALGREALFWRMRGRTLAQSAVRKGDWKLVMDDVNRSWELFRLNPDGTGEWTNLATNHPAELLDLLATFARWEKETLEPLFGQGTLPTINSPYVDSSDLGWLVEGFSTSPSYALVKLREPIGWDADFTLRWKMQVDAVGTNGFIAFGSAAAESSLFRAGLDRPAGRLSITEPSGAQSVLSGLNFPTGVLELELAYSRAERALTLRQGTNSLKRVLSASYPTITHIGYAVRRARTSFGFFELEPPVRLAIRDLAALPDGTLDVDVFLERGAPARLILERAGALSGPFVTVTNAPQWYLGGRVFRFRVADQAAPVAFYRVRAEL